MSSGKSLPFVGVLGYEREFCCRESRNVCEISGCLWGKDPRPETQGVTTPEDQETPPDARLDMTILPKTKKVSSTSTPSSSSTGPPASSAAGGSASEASSGVTGVPVDTSARKRGCSDRTGPDLTALTAASSAADAVGPGLSVGPSASKRRLRDTSSSSGSSDRRLRHHLHSLHEATTSSNKKATSVSQPQTGACSSYSDQMEVVDTISSMASASCMKLGVSGSESALTSGTSELIGSPVASVSLNSSDASTTQSESSVVHHSPPASPTGYNSGDEYGGRTATARASWTPEQLNEMERRFEKKLRKKGLAIMKMGEDGACLFRAVADQVYGDEEMHSLVRKLCCDYMTKNSDYFSQYVTEEFPQYVARKRRDHIQGNHVELQALSELFARPIEVYHYNSEPINIFQSGQDEDMLPDDEEEAIRLSYHTTSPLDSGHYNSVRTIRGTFKPKGTLLHFTPPHVMESAMRTSEADALEKAMLEDKIRASDWEATNEALEEQVARESYLEWLRENERRRRLSGTNGRHSPTLTTSSSTITATTTESGSRSPQAGGSRHYDDSQTARQNWTTIQGQRVSFAGESGSPPPPTAQQQGSKSSPKTQTSLSACYYDQVPDDAEEERQILARVMLASRQEYLDSLKARKSPTGSRSPKSASRASSPPVPSSSRTSV